MPMFNGRPVTPAQLAILRQITRDIEKQPELPKVAHKKPCRECPFRRQSAPGWLGGGDVNSWVQDLQLRDTAFVCHMAEAKGKRSYCAGSMIHKNNNLKVPRDLTMAEHQGKYGRDAENVFQWTKEFEDHHRNGPLAEKGKTDEAISTKRGAGVRR